MNKPYFRKQTQTWYCHHNGKQKRLSKDKVEAFAMWHELNAGNREVGPNMPIGDLIDDFLTWTRRNRDEKTHKWYSDFLVSFKDHIGLVAVNEVRVHHIESWIEDRYSDTSDSTRNGLIRAVSRVFNWGRKRQIIDTPNPACGMDRPASTPRKVYIYQQWWDEILAEVGEDNPLYDLLVVLRETGCRPDEACRVEARHVDRALEAWVFPIAESKGKRHERRVLLTDEALAITTKRMLKYPTGPLFRNSRGTPWSNSALTHRFSKLSTKLGFEFTPYAIRHTYITDALVNGVDPVTLAEIVGHQTLDMIHRVYAKVQLRRDHMKASVRKAVRGA